MGDEKQNTKGVIFPGHVQTDRTSKNVPFTKGRTDWDITIRKSTKVNNLGVWKIVVCVVPRLLFDEVHGKRLGTG